MILSTNIAESSITLPSVDFVIDFCLTKQLHWDADANWTSLELCWASRSSCEQRAGRCGRLRPGRVYRLVHDWYFNDFMCEDDTPELVRAPLHRSVLRVKVFEERLPPQDLLREAPSPPSVDLVRKSVLQLKQVRLDSGRESCHTTSTKV